MDSDSLSGSSSSSSDYSELNDEQLRAAIRFAEKRLRWVEEDHVTLLHAYREEIDAMRRQLVDRMLTRMMGRRTPLSAEQRRKLQSAFERRAMKAGDVVRAVRAASKGRTDRVDRLTEIEAVALLLHLQREV
jgi:hypothetical protein